MGRWILHVPHQSMQLRTNKQNKTHTHRETKPAAGIHIFSKAAKNGFYFPILLIIIERKPRSHIAKGFVHAKLDLHLVKQQKKEKKKEKS